MVDVDDAENAYVVASVDGLAPTRPRYPRPFPPPSHPAHPLTLCCIALQAAPVSLRLGQGTDAGPAAAPPGRADAAAHAADRRRRGRGQPGHPGARRRRRRPVRHGPARSPARLPPATNPSAPAPLSHLRALTPHRIAAHGGAALFVDYGHNRPGLHSVRVCAREVMDPMGRASPHRGPGAGRCQAIRKHRFEPVLAHPGLADLSADVDFSSLAVEQRGSARGAIAGRRTHPRLNEGVRGGVLGPRQCACLDRSSRARSCSSWASTHGWPRCSAE